MGKLLMMKSRKLLKNILITLGLTALATSIAFWFFHHVPENPANIALVYITALVLIARFTDGYLYGVLASLAGVIFVNYLFTYPYFELNFTLTGYPVTFLFMLIISITISAMTSQIKDQGRILVEREKLLMDAEKEKMRANLLRSVSHDLRTPLTGIIGNSSTYIENYDTLSEEEKLKKAGIIVSSVNYHLSLEEEIALKQIDAAKTELVNIYRFKQSSGKDRFDLAPEKARKLNDDRSYVCALLSWQLAQMRRENILRPKKEKASNLLDYFSIRAPQKGNRLVE